MKKGDHRKAALVGLRIVCHATLSAWSAAWDAVLLVWLLYGKASHGLTGTRPAGTKELVGI